MLAGMEREAVVEVRPGVPDDLPTLEHQVTDPPRAELLRGGEAGGAGADDDDIDGRIVGGHGLYATAGHATIIP